MLGSSNPALNRPEFQSAQTWDDLADTGPQGGGVTPTGATKSDVMTVGGTATKTFFLIAIVVAVTAVGWGFAIDMRDIGDGMQRAGISGAGLGMLFGGLIGGFIGGFAIMFKPNWSPVLAPVFAVFEGLFVCGVSAMVASRLGTPVAIEGPQDIGATGVNTQLVANAALLTLCIAGALCAAYGFKIVRPGRIFYAAFTVGMMGVMGFTLLAFGGGLISMLATGDAGFFGGMLSMFSFTNGGMISIGFSALLVVMASAALVIDYDQVNIAIKGGAPKYMEWYSGYAILVSIVWLYIEVLRLLAKLQSRD